MLNNDQSKLLTLLQLLEDSNELQGRTTDFMDFLNNEVFKLFFRGVK
jgi:hypothetical protein